MRLAINFLKTSDGTRTVRIRSKAWLLLAAQVRRWAPPALAVLGIVLGMALTLRLAFTLMLSSESRYNITPLPASEYQVQPRYRIPPPYGSWVPTGVTGIPPSTAEPANVFRHPTGNARSCLVVRNLSDRRMTCAAGDERFPVRPWSEVTVHVDAGWSEVRADSPGVDGMTRRVYLLPQQTYICTFCLDN